MSETTGNSLIRAQKLVHSECPSNGKFGQYSSWRPVDRINQKLTVQQKTMFQDSCFGKFLKLGLKPDRYFSGQLIHQLLIREVESPHPDEMWFLVGDKTIRFSLQEFCMVTGLKSSPCPKIDVRNVEGGRLVDEFFDGDLNLKICELEAAFLNASGSDETMVKLAMLYFLESVLLGRSKTKSVHENQYILLIDDFQQFQNYGWGRVCYEMMFNSLKKAIPSSTHMLKGFPYAFQVWAFEAIPSLDPHFALKFDCQLPRMCNWWSYGTPRSINVAEFFELKDLEVYTELELSEEEKQQDYLLPFIRPASCERSPTNSQEIEEPKVVADDAGMKRKLEIEDELEELCLAPRKLKTRFGDSNSLSLEEHEHTAPGPDSKQLFTCIPPEASNSAVSAPMEINYVESHSALPAAVDINDVSSYSALPGPVDANDVNSHSALPAPVDMNDVNSHSVLPAPVDMNDVNSHSALPAPLETNNVDSNSSLPTSVEIIDVGSSSTVEGSTSHLSLIHKTSPVAEPELADEEANQVNSVEEQTHDVQGTQPPVFWLREEYAFFERIKTMLEKSPQDFLQSQSSTTVPPEEINQAKRLLRPFYSMKFDQLANQSEQLESSIELLLEAGHFPPHLLDKVKSFHKNIARDIERHSNNCKSINKFEKTKRESEVHREELEKMKSHFYLTEKKIATETHKLEHISKSLSSKEEEVKNLVMSAKASADAFSRSLLRSKKLEEDKQEAERKKEEILNRWNKFKSVIRENL